MESDGIRSRFYMEERRDMEKVKELTGRLGESLFPDLPERKRQRIIIQIIAGISLALICITGMGIFHYKAVKQKSFLEF